MDKEYVVHIYSGILLNHKENEIMPLAATWMDIVIAILSEESQKEKDKCPLHVESNKNCTNELIYKIKTDSRISKPNFWLPKGKCRGK